MNRNFTVLLSLLCGIFFISSTIDLNNLFDYANQTIPSYINEDNTPVSNPITNGGATLGRVLFYDKKLSRNNTISCASCHKQEFAFGDTATVSVGWDGGTTGRHTPRLINSRFGEEEKFFWDERANTLEEQSTMPIQNHVEMGFSNSNGDPDMDSLIRKIESIDYYQELFTFVYGDFDITEAEIQDALAQFMRSIQSFDSKYDIGRAQVNNNNADFPNFTTEENLGKTLFMTNAAGGGANCQTCHNAPEFDIDENSNNNSVISVAGNPTGVDVDNTRSPTLRDLVNPDGTLNGPMMHDGSFTTLMDVIDLYDDITVDPANTNLDNRLNGGPGGGGQNLNLTQTEKDNLEAFLKTLTGSNVYTAEQWSDPFDINGNLTILNGVLPVELYSFEIEELDGNILLKWTTASEFNNRGFEIQHSLNAIDWEAIGFVDGIGESNEKTEYSFLDEYPESGYNYYRLKQIDYDGQVDFSTTLSHYFEPIEIQVNTYPNPVQDFLNIKLTQGEFKITLYNSNGAMLRQVVAEEQTALDFHSYPTGIYYLSIENEQQEFLESKKIIKR